MWTFTGLLLSLALAVSASPYASRIAGGSDAPEGKHPHQVSLWKDGEFHCGGSIIDQRYILTAAHCLHGVYAYQLRVGVGSRFLNETVDFYEVERYILHYAYNSKFVTNDIGLIRLTRKIVYGHKVKPIRLAVRDFIREGYPLTFTGWGRLYHTGPVPNCLQEIELRVADSRKCDGAIGGLPVGPKQVCTFTKYGEGPCHGDSGGPLVADGYQIGVASFSVPCGVGVPDVFTRVYPYRSWIAESMADHRQ